MADIFDEIETKGDVFDELDAQPKRDIFDSLDGNDLSPFGRYPSAPDPFSEPEIIDVRPSGNLRTKQRMAEEMGRLREVGQDAESLQNIGLMTPFETGGNIVRGAVADLSALGSTLKRPEGKEVPLLPSPSLIKETVSENLPFAISQSGNTAAALRGDPLPVDAMLAEVAPESPAAATLGKIQQGLAGSAPLIAVMPQGALGKLVAAGFTADMLRHAGPDATALGEEMGKPPEERDYDKLTSALSGLVQTTAFAPATGVHAGTAPLRSAGRFATEKIAPNRAAINELARQLQAEPIAPRATVDESANIRLNLPPRAAPQPVLPELQRTGELVDRALQEATQRIQVPGQTPAIELLKAQGNEIIPGAVAPEFRPGGGEARGGNVSFSRPAEEVSRSADERQQFTQPASVPARPELQTVENRKPLRSTEDIIRDKLSKRELVSAVDLLQKQPAEVQRRIIDDAVGAGRKKVGLNAAEQTIFNELWDKVYRDSLANQKGVPNALEPEATQPLRNVREEPIKGQGEVPGEGAGRAPDVRGGEEGSLSVAQAPEVSAEASRFIDEYRKPTGKVSNLSDTPDAVTTVKAGMGLKSIADLDAVLAANNEVRGILQSLRAKQRSGEKLTPEEAQQFFQAAGKVQFPREVIETATNFGGWSEANQARGPVPRPLGERPLDYQKNPEVAAWLERNGEQLGLDVSEIRSGELRSKPGFALDELDSLPHGTVMKLAEQFNREYPGAPKLNIARDYQGMPDAAHQAAYRLGTSPHLIEAFVGKNGEIWINASAVKFPADVARLASHEAIGHFATDAIKGPKLKKFMEQVHESWKNDPLMETVKRSYPGGDNVLHGREYVARLAENPKANPTAWNKIVAQFREWLRDIGWVKKVSENDLRVLLQKAADSLRAKEGGLTPEEASLSLKTASQAAQQRYPPPPAGGPPSSPAAPASPAPSRVTLDDIYKIFEPTPKTSPTLRQRGTQAVESFRTGVSSKFRPVNKLAQDIAKAYGRTSSKDIAGIMEQLKGSQGKAEADIYRFDRDVSDLVKGDEKDFNAYMFLQRTIDRLNQDAADVAAGLPARRAVSNYTLADIGPKLRLLESKLGPEKLRQFELAARQYQAHMDQALRLQVESGRMSPQVYADIKAGNQFYAPFKVMKYIEEQSRPAGSGKRIDTLADFTKAMEGIEDPNVKLGDMLAAARQGISMSRILADKNTAMRNVAELAAFDTQGLFIKKLQSGQDAPRGMEAVNVLEAGKETRYAVAPEVAEAIQLYGGNAGGVISRMLGAFSVPFRAGATALNLPFQISNLMADVPRQALMSKYGIRNPADFVRYPMDFIHSLYSSIKGDVFGKDSKLFLDFLDSGVAGTTVQEYLTPDALKFQETSNLSRGKKLAKTVINTIPEFAKAIEQTSKVMGVKRAMRFEGVTSGKELAKQVPEAITELRRFSGSPDFGRQGKWVEQARLNLLYMFLNARLQGAIADIGRLGGRDGAKTAATSWMKIATAVGIPTAYLYYLNQRPEYKDDYEKRTAQEKQNYWLIPKDSFITNDDGEQIRDYWRIPKRESSKWIANLTESALDFADKRDPKAAKDFGASMIQEISPVNISGENTRERLESVASSLNPLIKAPLELASGRDLYRHRNIIPDSRQKASPEQQYTPRTAEAFKVIANAMPDVAPEFLRSPLLLDNLTRNLTAGLITQFMPRKPIEGRSALENTPLLARFQGLPYTDNTAAKEQLQQLEREAADEQLARHRQAVKLMDDNKGKSLESIVQAAPKDEKLLRHLVDLWVAKENGITSQELPILALPVNQRAIYVLSQINGLDPAAKNQKIMDLARKRILTEGVIQAMGDELK